MVYDVTETAQQVTAEGVITTPGSRIQSIFLDPENDRTGEYLFDVSQGGFLVNREQALFDLATIDFTARGGDNFATLANISQERRFTIAGVTYQQALEQYIRDDLGGIIDAADIPSGEGIRVRDISVAIAPPTQVPEPATVVGFVAVGLILTRFKRRS